MSYDQRNIALRGSLAFGFRPSSELIRRTLKEPSERPEMVFEEKRVPILCENPDMTGRIRYLDMTEGCFILIISPPGSGKTFFMRGLIGDLVKFGYGVVDLCSIKNNFFWSYKPVQEKFQPMLPEWRVPEALPVSAYIPRYLAKKQAKSSIHSRIEVGQLSLRDIEPIDLIISCLKLTERTYRRRL